MPSESQTIYRSFNIGESSFILTAEPWDNFVFHSKVSNCHISVPTAAPCQCPNQSPEFHFGQIHTCHQVSSFTSETLSAVSSGLDIKEISQIDSLWFTAVAVNLTALWGEVITRKWEKRYCTFTARVSDYYCWPLKHSGWDLLAVRVQQWAQTFLPDITSEG